ncbi:hypothetical protein LIS82_10605 [Cytobacillus solani]|uniref:Uncharacterized protein n=1 Tax=Cytobacillus solani TaxID=1637975 RepID=A0A0Q3QMM3_9BACI|nr:hypothetical protein [Cytobacillus solani]KQL18966.1 hypothetical protein AN957_10525 [Cytobacillus solani]USK56889.1 hypothetical protein LIS82_10605 [Cytobacillus solani]
MVTAIVIPIICLYFYWIAKRDMRDSMEKWEDLKSVAEEAIIYGEIKEVTGSKQRFSYYRFVYILELSIQMEQRKWIVRKVIPIEKGVTMPKVEKGDYVHVYGNWKQDYFQVSRVEKRA